MNAKETVKSWRWRIVRVEYTATQFADMLGISRGVFSEYLTAKKAPSLERFDIIESKLRELEAEKGIV